MAIDLDNAGTGEANGDAGSTERSPHPDWNWYALIESAGFRPTIIIALSVGSACGLIESGAGAIP